MKGVVPGLLILQDGAFEQPVETGGDGAADAKEDGDEAVRGVGVALAAAGARVVRRHDDGAGDGLGDLADGGDGVGDEEVADVPEDLCLFVSSMMEDVGWNARLT